MFEANDESTGRYYIRIRGRVTGPYEREQLATMSNRGQLGRMHEVSIDGIRWQRADEVLPAAAPTAKASQSHALAPEADYGVARAEAPRKSKPGGAPTIDGAQWYYSRGQESIGPLPFAVMQDLIRKNVLSADDLVWNESMENWQPAASVFGLPTRQAKDPDGEKVDSVRASAQSSDDYRRVSAMAVTSLILGILWLGGFGSIMAIVFGSVSLYQIRLSKGRLAGTGLAIAGLVLGVVFLGFQVFSWFYWHLNLLNPDFDR